MGSEPIVRLTVVNPSGLTRLPIKNAPRLDTLDGKTIGEIWNGTFRADATFPIIRKLLKERFPTVKFVPYTEFPVEYPDPIKIPEAVKAKGCDAVIVGNGA